jgi:D-alanine-D-alanine ligase
VGQPKIRVAVVFGGRSTEHAVSCASAGLILSAIDPDRYEVLPIGIATDGRWVLTSGDPARLALSSGSVPSVESVAVGDGEIVSRAGPSGSALQVLSPGSVPRDLGSVDVVLPLLHGTYGEDGTLQGLLEMTGTRYVGAGVFASAAGMDKEYMKLLMSARGLPAGRYVVVRERDWRAAAERKRILDEIAELGWPVFVKPARGGSSIGITRVCGFDGLEDAIEAARAHDPKVLVEAAVDGIEVECAVLEGLDGGPPEASVPGQVVVDPASDFYDFEAKYLASATTMRIPAPVPVEAASEIRRMACAAFDAISCEGLARVDFFYTPAGQVLVNEINTMPGMTPASGFPMMWAASGLPLPQLVDRIIQTALRKRPGLRLALARRVWLAAGRVGWLRSLVGLAGRVGWSGWLVGLAGRVGWLRWLVRRRPRAASRVLPRMPPAAVALLRPWLLLGLLAVDERLEVRTSAELGHRGTRHLDGRAGGRVAGRAGGPLALLEDAEPGDGYLVAARDGGLNGLEHRVHGFGGGFLVPQPSRDRVDQITLVHGSLLRFPHRSRGLRNEIATSDLPESRRSNAVAQ